MHDDTEHEKIILKARPEPPRKPLIAVTAAEIATMVAEFYGAVRADARLGPIFEDRIAGKWDFHIARMNLFWRSVLLHSGEYGGQPVVKHNALPDLKEDDFRIWIGLFDATVDRLFDTQRAMVIANVARRIARSLWLARFGTPFNRTPDWLD